MEGGLIVRRARADSRFEMLSTWSIHVDGVEHAHLRQDESWAMPELHGQHLVQIRCGRRTSNPVEVRVAPGSLVQLLAAAPQAFRGPRLVLRAERIGPGATATP